MDRPGVECRCPSCGTVAVLRPQGGQARCLRCGVPIALGPAPGGGGGPDPAGAPGPAPGAAAPARGPAATEPCPACGEPLAVTAARCASCGQRRGSPPAARPRPDPSPVLRVGGALVMALPVLGVLDGALALLRAAAPALGFLRPPRLPIGGLWTFALALGPWLGGKGFVFVGLVLTILHLYLGFGVWRGERAAVRWLTALAIGVVLACFALVPSSARTEFLLMAAVFYGPPCAYGALARDRLSP